MTFTPPIGAIKVLWETGWSQIEIQVESSRSLLPGRAAMGHRMFSPWQTDVQQCTSACAIEEVIVDAMCRQLPANADGEVNATCRLLHGEATSERGRTSATHANARARASP